MKLKPYDLVRVKRDGYSFIGQVISYPFGDNNERVKVRRVPDDPVTMEEMDVSDLTPVKKTDYRWVHYAEIDGSGSFPVDMLRYDNSAPVNFHLENQGRLETPTAVLHEGDWKGSQLVIARVTDTRDPSWTQGRWNSFLWGVKPLKSFWIKGT